MAIVDAKMPVVLSDPETSDCMHHQCQTAMYIVSSEPETTVRVHHHCLRYVVMLCAF